MSKRSITIRGRRTSVYLQDAFWQELGVIAVELDCSREDLIASIDRNHRGTSSRSGAIRIWVVDDVMARATGVAAPATAASHAETLQ